jgi:hypothetical protein
MGGLFGEEYWAYFKSVFSASIYCFA